MSHPRWPGYNTKSGDPVLDNAARRMNKRMYKSTQSKLKFAGYKNRKRKKALWRVEGGNYIRLWAAFATDLARQHTTAPRTSPDAPDTETGES